MGITLKSDLIILAQLNKDLFPVIEIIKLAGSKREISIVDSIVQIESR
ncbi:hypothetical protein ES703_19758 [subsurface metagenome]